MQSANYDSPTTIQGNALGEAVPVTSQGAAAEDAAVSGSPVQIAIEARSSAKTSVTSGDVVRPVGSLAGVLATMENASATDASSNTAGQLIDLGGARRPLWVYNSVFNGTNWDRLRGDTAGIITRGQGNSASGVFTPAAASHTAGDVNGAAATFDLNAPASCVFEIMSASLLINNATIETTAWTLHLYSVTPPSALADDAAFNIPSGDQASYLGFISLAQVVDYGDSLYIESNDIGKRVQLAASGDLFGYLVNGTTLTPGAVAHTVKLIGRPV